MSEEKTEEATPQRLREAREKGQAAKSPELSMVMALGGVIAILFCCRINIVSALLDMLRSSILGIGNISLSPDSVCALFINRSSGILLVLLPFFLFVIIFGIGGNLLQVGFLFNLENLNPKLEKINPLSGLKKIFSKKGAVEILKSILKILITVGVSYLFMRRELDQFFKLIQGSPKDAFLKFGELFAALSWRILGVLFILAFLDYLYQRWEFKKQLMMSKYEVKEEYKRLEGDPFMRSRLRERQKEFIKRRMLDGVRKSRVVITNPTHLAVALKYKEGEDDVPVVVAKGKGYIAESIKKIAAEHRIAIVENPPVARNLYNEVEIGQKIPPSFYMVVAEIIAFLERVKL